MTGIPLALNLLLLAVAVGVGVLLGRRLAKKHPDFTWKVSLRKVRFLYAPVGLLFIFLAAVFSLQFFPTLQWVLPLWLEYTLTALVWGGILVLISFLFSLGVSAGFSVGLDGCWKVLFVGVLSVVAVQIAQWQFTVPVAPILRNIINSDGIVMQSSDVSCAAASAANLVRRFGLTLNEKDFAERFGTTELGGTSNSQIIYGMKHFGFICKRITLDSSALKTAKPPIMLFIDHPAVRRTRGTRGLV